MVEPIGEQRHRILVIKRAVGIVGLGHTGGQGRHHHRDGVDTRTQVTEGIVAVGASGGHLGRTARQGQLNFDPGEARFVCILIAIAIEIKPDAVTNAGEQDVTGVIGRGTATRHIDRGRVAAAAGEDNIRWQVAIAVVNVNVRITRRYDLAEVAVAGGDQGVGHPIAVGDHDSDIRQRCIGADGICAVAILIHVDRAIDQPLTLVAIVAGTDRIRRGNGDRRRVNPSGLD